MKKCFILLFFLVFLSISKDSVNAAPEHGIEFDGIDDYMVIPHAENLNFGIDDNFTIEFWVKPDHLYENTMYRKNHIISKHSLRLERTPFVIEYHNESDGYRGALTYGVVFPSESGVYKTTTVKINDNKWHHVALSREGGSRFLYIDGEQKAFFFYDSEDTKNTSDIFIGSLGHNIDSLFKGTIADLRIWRVRRTKEEVFDNMNKVLAGDEDGLVGYWKLDGIRNGVIKDYTTNANHGVLYNSDLEDLGDETDEPISVDLDSTVGIASGVLSIIKPSLTADFGDIVLNGNIQESSASIDAIMVTDARGTGEGWHLTVSATEFTEVGGNGYKLPSGSLTLKFPKNVSALSGNNPILPFITAASAVIDDGDAHVILTAGEAEGLGSFEATFPESALTLSINPAHTFVDRQTYDNTPTLYETAITWSIISGP